MTVRISEKQARIHMIGINTIHAQTSFAHTVSGRISYENSPDRGPAPLFWFGGGAYGNAVRFRSDVPDSIVRKIEMLIATEAPLTDFESAPRSLSEIQKILSEFAPALKVKKAVAYTFRDAPNYNHSLPVTKYDTSKGEQLLARIDADGMPHDLFDMGFIDRTHFWPPWCIVCDGDSIASIAFTARRSEAGAEVGVVTTPLSRGRGFAAAAVSAWASLPAFSNLPLFYGTDSTNVSSQRVAERLQLARLGPILSMRD